MVSIYGAFSVEFRYFSLGRIFVAPGKMEVGRGRDIVKLQTGEVGLFDH